MLYSIVSFINRKDAVEQCIQGVKAGFNDKPGASADF